MAANFRVRAMESVAAVLYVDSSPRGRAAVRRFYFRILP